MYSFITWKGPMGYKSISTIIALVQRTQLNPFLYTVTVVGSYVVMTRWLSSISYWKSLFSLLCDSHTILHCSNPQWSSWSSQFCLLLLFCLQLTDQLFCLTQLLIKRWHLVHTRDYITMAMVFILTCWSKFN